MTEQNNPLDEQRQNLLVFIWKRRKIIGIVTGVAAVISVIVSFLLTPLYRSTAVVFPAATSTVSFSEQRNAKAASMDFGEEEQAEQLVQILSSSRIRDKIVEQFDLMAHYDIAPDDKNKHYKLVKEYENHFFFVRTRYGSIQIDVLGDTSLIPGKTCTLIATATPLSTSNTFAWFLNGTQVVGATGSSLIVDIDKIGLYSVRVTTPSGCSTTSSSRRITAASSANVWVVPNPSTGRFQVRFYSRATVFNFKRTLLVYDTRGVLVHSVTVPITAPYSSIDVDLTAKPRGMYFLFLRKENEEKLGAGRIFLY